MGSSVHSGSKMRVGLGIAPKMRSIVLSVSASSNLPETISTALSG